MYTYHKIQKNKRKKVQSFNQEDDSAIQTLRNTINDSVQGDEIK